MTTMMRQPHNPPATFPGTAPIGQHGEGSVSRSPGGDDLADYFRDLEAFPVLSEEAQYELAMRSMHGDLAAQQQLIAHNLRLVVSIAHRYTHRGMDLKDLVQEGSIGLIFATRKFNPQQARFSTYAHWWINQTITRALDERGTFIHIPAHVHYKELNPLKRARTRLLQENGEEPGIEALAERTGIAAARIAELLRADDSVVSFDQPLGQDTDLLVAETLGDDNAEFLEDTVTAHVLASEIRMKAQELLTTQQYRVLFLRYGFNESPAHNVPATAKQLGISPQRVCQLEASALRALRSSSTFRRFSTDDDDKEAQP